MAISFQFKPVGIVHSPFKKKEDISVERQTDPRGFDDVRGEIEIFKEYEAGLKDIEGFSHLVVIFAFHRAQEARLEATPPFDHKPRGVFSTRSPHRPNPIGMTVVKLIQRKKNFLKVSGMDMIEGTPVLDIKPYTGRDQKSPIKTGWHKITGK